MKELLEQIGIDEEAAGRILKAHDDEMKQQQLSYSIKEELEKSGAVDIQAAAALLDRNEISSENIGERIKKLAGEHPALFESKQPVRIVTAASASKGDDKRSFDKMSYMQRLKLFHTDPELYQKLL